MVLLIERLTGSNVVLPNINNSCIIMVNNTKMAMKIIDQKKQDLMIMKNIYIGKTSMAYIMMKMENICTD
jgi:hypothetical protein